MCIEDSGATENGRTGRAKIGIFFVEISSLICYNSTRCWGILTWEGMTMMEVQPVQGFSPEVRALANSPENVRKVAELAEACHIDSDKLDRLNQQGSQTRAGAFRDFGVDSPKGIEVVFVANSEKVEHFIIPSDPNAELKDDELASVGGGSGTVSTLLSFTSISTIGSQ